MGKKTKTGKGRLDKYYHLAKEQGYRARSAFKLIQLSQKNDIFSGCRSLLDLCAAPGGWLQVAQKNMPVASTIVGVDLAPIRPIRGVTTFQADITTQRCRNLLKGEIPVGTCDIVLHDGAPNVGTSWLHDAYAQNELVLHATKLACEFVRLGGTFITKVFRSQDYASLLWVFQQLFEKVVATKPSSSRNVSAEIFVICEKYKQPQKIDPRFFDPKFVFVNTESQAQKEAGNDSLVGGKEQKRGLSELVKTMSKKNRQGYNDGDDYRVSTVTQFFQVKDQSPAEFITNHHKIVFPDDDLLAQRINADPSTTSDIHEFCEDLKVLGKREYSILLKWRHKIIKKWADETKVSSKEGCESAGQADENLNSEDEKMQWERELVVLTEKMAKGELNHKRKLREKLKKLTLQRQMSLGAFDGEQTDPELFSLKYKNILEEEDEILEKSGILLEEVESGVQQQSDDSETELFCEGSDSNNNSDESDDDDDEMVVDDDQNMNYISKLAVDLEIAAELEKERKGLKAAKKELKKKKETRRQKVYSEWSKEIESYSAKMNEENYVSKCKLDDEDEVDDDDGVPEATEFKIAESDAEEDEEILKAALSNKKGMRSTNDKKGQDVLKKYKLERWLDQDMFKAAGVTLKELEIEDKRINNISTTEETHPSDDESIDQDITHRTNDDDDNDEGNNTSLIREVSDSELVEMPKTEKQKRKEKRKRETEKKESRDAHKKAKLKIGALGVPVENEPDPKFEEVPISYSVQTPTFGDESENDDEKPKTSEEIAEIQALGSLMVRKNTRMDLIDGAYNRFAFHDDECVPIWFIEDEEMYNKPELPVTKELMQQYKQKLKEIAQRPIRKVLEAQGRHRLRLKKRLEKVKKQAQHIAESTEQSELSKAKSIHKLIRKAKKNDKQEKTYVVSRKQGDRKSASNKKSGGVIKLVDKRLKSDKRGRRAAERRNKKRK